ncbi:Het6 heterokaryon incompatibility [Fusarium heterosporum]|uniref:Het6 heterokaryon incompatibility n=1 Tax=Fusarium heterosporum TaxID=42747 RepID=A0A8H5WEK7_FUSHE|nr:Het6 heterokaryon incompatibility [Fusarium heterosporum]
MEQHPLGFLPYEPLRNNEIRLLHVEPGVSKRISIQLSNVNLDTQPAFWALSYVWGPSENPAVVTINGIPFSVTRNLYHALVEYRRQFSENNGKTANSFLWVDAICLNQSDHIEKSIQVPRMSLIYGRCERVLAWLGPVEDDDMADVHHLADKLKIFEAPADSGHQSTAEDDRITSFRKSAYSDPKAAAVVESVRRALRSIGRRPWFRRIWILQEAVLAQRQPLLLCGQFDLGYEIFFKTWVMMLDPSHDGQLLHTFATTNPVRFKAIEVVYGKILSDRRSRIQENAIPQVDEQRQCAIEVLELLNETTELEATVLNKLS